MKQRLFYARARNLFTLSQDELKRKYRNRLISVYYFDGVKKTFNFWIWVNLRDDIKKKLYPSAKCYVTTKKMTDIEIIVRYFDEQVGHHTDKQRMNKLIEEVRELKSEIYTKEIIQSDKVIDECSDVLTVAFHIAKRSGFKGDANDLVVMAYRKMKGRIEAGERNYKNGYSK